MVYSVEKLGGTNLKQFIQSPTARRERCFGLLSREKQFVVPRRANVFLIRKHRPENPSFSTEPAVCRR